MTTREEIIALRDECDEFAEQTLLCKGEFHPDFHKVSDERFYAIAHEAGRQAEREECCAIVFGQCGSDNVAQRTVDAIRARGTK